MKKSIKFLCLLLCVLLCSQLLTVPVQASSEVPYQTYNNDKWGNTTPAPNGYLPNRSLGGAQLGCGNFASPMDLFYCSARGEVYVVDTGNARIVVLSEQMELLREITVLTGADGSEYTFVSPQGIFVRDDGTMYVADTGKKEVVVGTAEGAFLSVLPTPDSNLLPDNFNYLPTKVIVDSHDRTYILSQGIYQGLIYLDSDGSFIKFFGPNEVEMTFRRQVMKIWKTILPDEAAATMQSFNPIEYGNIFLAENEFIYATAAGTENGSKLITRLNPLGIDTLPFKLRGNNVVLSDVTVDSNGIMTVLNTSGGGITQYNESGNQMFNMGGIGDQVGLFQRAVSIIEVNSNLYVLDADKNTITEFVMTDFGKLVRNAINLYDAGLYQESIEPWKEVIRHNANYLLAYTGLGKAYYQLKQYDTAMYYYKLANDRANYSQAFREASLNNMRQSFGTIVLSVVGVVVAFFLVRMLWRRVDFQTLFSKRRKRRGKEGGK